MAAFLSSRLLIAAIPDAESPVNTGSFLLRPSRPAFDALLAVLQNLSFSVSAGFNSAGQPRSLEPDLRMLARGLGAGVEEAARLLNTTGMYQRNRWNFASAAFDQGLFWWFFYLQHHLGTWTAATAGPIAGPIWRVDNWWGANKPVSRRRLEPGALKKKMPADS